MPSKKSKCAGHQPPCPKSCHSVKASDKKKAHCRKDAPKGTKKNPRQVGTRLQVWRGTANHTKGGLKKDDLVKNKAGKIVSLKKYQANQENRLWKLTLWRRALRDLGYLKKGEKVKQIPKKTSAPKKPAGKKATAEAKKEYEQKLAQYKKYEKLMDHYYSLVEQGPFRDTGIGYTLVKSQRPQEDQEDE